MDGRPTALGRSPRIRRVRVVDNPGRIQAAGLNRGLAIAQGEIIVRVDGHCALAEDYVELCVAALEQTGAAMVGGGMTPTLDPASTTITQRGIASAMASRLGAGPARFHVGGPAGWVDTVYLGAYRAETRARSAATHDELAVNEDSEFAIRMRPLGGIWFDPRIRSTYTPRATLSSLAEQFYRYGRGRAATARRHPRHVRPRQLVAPALVLGLLGRQASHGCDCLRSAARRTIGIRAHEGSSGCTVTRDRASRHAPVMGSGLLARSARSDTRTHRGLGPTGDGRIGRPWRARGRRG